MLELALRHRAAPARRTVKTQAVQPLHQGGQCDLAVQARKGLAEAEVRPHAEGEVAILNPLDVEDIRLREAGRGRLAVGLHSRVHLTPIFGTGTPAAGRSVSEMILGLITNRVASPGDGHAARLARPVVEKVSRRGAYNRRVESSGYQWLLPSPDGL